MPKPKPNESKKDYISRCIAYVVKNEGKKQDQAYNICQGLWDKHHKRSAEDEEQGLILGG